MKKKNLPALGFALALLLVLVVAAAIDYRALNSNQFTTSGTVSVKSGATVTNMQTYAPDAFYEIWLKSPLSEVDFGLIFTNSASKTIAILDGEDRTPLGSIDLNGFHGGGSGLTALNASALSSGTVPTARLGSGTANSTTVLRGDNTWGASSGGFTNMAVGTITYGATITPSLAIADIVAYPLTPRRLTFRCTLTGDITTVNAPTGTAVDGDTMVWEMIQDGTGSRLISGFNAIYIFGTDITGITLTTTASKRDFISWTYNSTATKWYCTGFARGY